MIKLGCQLEYVWNQSKPNHLGYVLRSFLIGSFEVERPPTHTKSATHLWMAVIFAFSLFALILTSKFMCPVPESSPPWY